MYIFSGIYKGRKIESPKGLATRPTSGRLRETLFNICRGEIEGGHFLDLFAGSGAMGFEALSRGAASAVFVDSSKESIRCINENANRLSVGKQCQVIYGDVFSTLKNLSKKGFHFDIIYADPPYDTYISGNGERRLYSEHVIKEIEESIRAGYSLLNPGGSVFLEDAEALAKVSMSNGYLALKDTRKTGRAVLQHWVAV